MLYLEKLKCHLSESSFQACQILGGKTKRSDCKHYEIIKSRALCYNCTDAAFKADRCCVKRTIDWLQLCPLDGATEQ